MKQVLPASALANEVSHASIGGGGASENSFYLNGFPITNPLSQLGGMELPFGAIQQASRHLDRFTQIIEVGGQAPDHPIHGAIPETRYLKSIVSRIVHD